MFLYTVDIFFLVMLFILHCGYVDMKVFVDMNDVDVKVFVDMKFLWNDIHLCYQYGYLKVS